MPSVQLSSAGLRQVPFDQCPDDFFFLVGQQRHVCHRLLADFLSPLVSRLHMSDPTLRELRLKTVDSSNLFPEFLRLGHSVCLTDSMITFFSELAVELDAAEICHQIGQYLDDGLTCDNVLHRVQCGQALSRSITREVTFIASHFSEVSAAVLNSFGNDLLFDVLSDSNLRILDEDALFECVAGRTEIDADYFQLLQFVQFEHLSDEATRRLIELGDTFLEHITRPVWRSIARRLLERSPSSRRGVKSLSYPLRSESPLDGIISGLTRRFGGHVHSQGIVMVTSNSAEYSSGAPPCAADVNPENAYCSAGKPGAWICYDFKGRTIRPTAYALRFRSGGWSGSMDTWAIEGSMNGADWVELDRQVGVTGIDGKNAIRFWFLRKVQEVRWIRLKLINFRSPGNTHVILSFFELFGELLEADQTLQEIRPISIGQSPSPLFAALSAQSAGSA
jgi:hypothetical protein